MVSRLLELVRRKRRHAGFFHWPDRRVAERHVVLLFSEAAQARGEPGLKDIVSAPIDPPDCEAVGRSGERVGIEVTELVDQDLAGQRPMTTRPKFWETAEVVGRLNEIIRRKDLKCRHVVGFARLVLLIHTDEMFLRGYAGDDILEDVQRAAFDRSEHFDEVVFMVSYDPRIKSYPFVRLRLSPELTG